MTLAIQIVKDNIQNITEDISFFSEYKYWIFLATLFFVFFLIRLFKIWREKQFNESLDHKIDKETIEIIVEKEHVLKPKLIKKTTTSKPAETKEVQNPKITSNLVDRPKVQEFDEEAVVENIISKEEKSNKIKSIGYQPTEIFEQGENYQYPLVIMPNPLTKIKFPRKGCSNKQGFTEGVFFKYMQAEFENDFQLFNDRHIPSKNRKFVYEPDIVLISENNGKNIFIDVEIDEPYEAFSRTPTHEVGKDGIRNKFFTDRGWIVIRFSEIQIHQDPKECCYHIAKVIAAIDPSYEIPFHLSLYGDLEKRESWDSLQAKKWAKQNYREQYLGINNFGIRPNIISNYDIIFSDNDALLESNIDDGIKLPKYEKIKGPLKVNENKRDKRLRFDPVAHRYYIDGNPDTISVSQLIAKFFPEFDSEYWSQKKADERGVEVQEILLEWETKRNTAANLGTALHEEIENYYNGLPYNGEELEFQHFLKFKERYPTMKPYRSEWRIFDEEFLIAGTIDMVYQKEDNQLYMFDWKRSEKVVDASGDLILPNYSQASGELCHLSDNSYYKYALQQNIYRYILEKHYNKEITSMNLLVLHPSFETYHLVQLPDLTQEVQYIFENSIHYR